MIIRIIINSFSFEISIELSWNSYWYNINILISFFCIHSETYIILEFINFLQRITSMHRSIFIYICELWSIKLENSFNNSSSFFDLSVGCITFYKTSCICHVL